MQLHALVSELLGLEHTVHIIENSAVETEENQIVDIRAMAEPCNLAELSCDPAVPYYQVFASRNGFIPNLSVVDLLFNMGPEGLIVLRDAKMS